MSALKFASELYYWYFWLELWCVKAPCCRSNLMWNNWIGKTTIVDDVNVITKYIAPRIRVKIGHSILLPTNRLCLTGILWRSLNECDETVALLIKANVAMYRKRSPLVMVKHMPSNKGLELYERHFCLLLQSSKFKQCWLMIQMWNHFVWPKFFAKMLSESMHAISTKTVCLLLIRELCVFREIFLL